jgi:hypothetical protein
VTLFLCDFLSNSLSRKVVLHGKDYNTWKNKCISSRIEEEEEIWKNTGGLPIKLEEYRRITNQPNLRLILASF